MAESLHWQYSVFLAPEGTLLIRPTGYDRIASHRIESLLSWLSSCAPMYA